MKKAYGLILLLLFSLPSLAQTQTVSGRVLDGKDQSPLIGANVVLVHLPDSVKKGGAADAEGNFTVPNVAAGRYILSISFLGYQNLNRPVTVGSQALQLGTLALQPGGVVLKGVEVVGKLPAAVQKGDTAQFNANAFKTNPDANAQELITKMPGIVVQDGKVQAQGEEVQRIFVDGKEFFGNDPDAVLKNLPAEIIESIQVYDRQSEQSQFSGFNDGNTQKTLNIVTKPQYRRGQFGRFVAGFGGGEQTEQGGWAERYQVNGNLNMFSGDRRVSIIAQSNNVNGQNFGTDDQLGVTSGSRRGGGGSGGGRGRVGGGGNSNGSSFVSQGGGISRTSALGLNYSDKWGQNTQVTGSYFFNQTNNTASTFVDRQYANVAQLYQENSLVNSRNRNHRFNLRLEQKIDSANSLLFIPRLSVQENRSNSTLNGTTFVGDVLRGNTRSDYRSDQTGITSSNQLLYRHRFAKAGRTMSLDLNANYNSRSGDNNLYTLTDTASLDQFSRLSQTGWSLSSGLAYTEPLTKQDLLQFNYNVSYAPNDSDKKTYDLDEASGEYSALNQGLSNVFASSYLTQGVGASYLHRTEQVQLSVGVTGQKADLNNRQQFPVEGMLDRTFYNFLPNASFRYKFTKERNLRLNYNGRTSAPSINQLQEVVNNANPLQLTTGNPFLDQQFQHTIALRYSAAQPEKSTSFFVGAFGSYTNDYITNSTFVATADTLIKINGGQVLLPLGGQLTRPINLGNQYSIRTFANYSLPINVIKSNLNLNGSASYSRTPGINNQILNYSQSPAFNLGATLSSNISQNVDFTLSSSGSMTYARNTANVQLNTNFYVQNSAVRLNWIIGPGINFQTDVTHQYNQGLASTNQQYMLWNASLGKKVFSRMGEFRLYAFDILKQNRSIQNNITVAYNERVTTNNLRQFFMLMFTYNLRRGNMPNPDGGDRDRSDRPERSERGNRPDGPRPGSDGPRPGGDGPRPGGE